jgi:hypothetical protein
LKLPFLARHAITRSAFDGPTPGSICSCSLLAVLRLSLPASACLLLLFFAGLSDFSSFAGFAVSSAPAAAGVELSQVAVVVATSAHRAIAIAIARIIL